MIVNIKTMKLTLGFENMLLATSLKYDSFSMVFLLYTFYCKERLFESEKHCEIKENFWGNLISSKSFPWENLSGTVVQSDPKRPFLNSTFELH